MNACQRRGQSILVPRFSSREGLPHVKTRCKQAAVCSPHRLHYDHALPNGFHTVVAPCFKRNLIAMHAHMLDCCVQLRTTFRFCGSEPQEKPRPGLEHPSGASQTVCLGDAILLVLVSHRQIALLPSAGSYLKLLSLGLQKAPVSEPVTPCC